MKTHIEELFDIEKAVRNGAVWEFECATSLTEEKWFAGTVQTVEGLNKCVESGRSVRIKPLPFGVPSDRKADGPESTGLSTPHRALLPCEEALQEITKLLTDNGVTGVQGFSITVKSGVSQINLKWGNLKIKGKNP